jgi:hypothetical protein
MNTCAYCGIYEGEGAGCPTCGRKNCIPCAAKFNLHGLVCLGGAVMCPPPHNCSEALFFTVEKTSNLFGTFGARVPAAVETRYTLVC